MIARKSPSGVTVSSSETVGSIAGEADAVAAAGVTAAGVEAAELLGLADSTSAAVILPPGPEPVTVDGLQLHLQELLVVLGLCC